MYFLTTHRQTTHPSLFNRPIALQFRYISSLVESENTPVCRQTRASDHHRCNYTISLMETAYQFMSSFNSLWAKQLPTRTFGGFYAARNKRRSGKHPEDQHNWLLNEAEKKEAGNCTKVFQTNRCINGEYLKIVVNRGWYGKSIWHDDRNFYFCIFLFFFFFFFKFYFDYWL